MKKYLYILGICLPGIAMQFVSNPGLVLLLAALLLFSAVSSVCIVIIYLFDKKFKIAYLAGFLPLIFAFLFASFFRSVKYRQATKIQKQIEAYKSTHNEYPADLQQLAVPYYGNKFSYSLHADRKEYVLEYTWMESTECILTASLENGQHSVGMIR